MKRTDALKRQLLSDISETVQTKRERGGESEGERKSATEHSTPKLTLGCHVYLLNRHSAHTHKHTQSLLETLLGQVGDKTLIFGLWADFLLN